MFPVCGRVSAFDFAPIVRIPPKSDNPSGGGGSPLFLWSLLVSAMIVTLDGPGGTGKSTVSQIVAHKSGLPHLDTGAYYRAATLAVLDAGVDPNDGAPVGDLVRHLRLGQEGGVMYLDGRDVADEIRSPQVTAAVSAVSAHATVRSELVEKQRAWILEHDGRGVVEGRDIGSVVFPDADLKIYLDASPDVRARRRARETGEEFESVLAELNRRDHFDSTRPASPLIVPEGAISIDTSGLTLDQVVDQILRLISAKS